MHRVMLKSKIHRATITQCDLHYVGSLTIDQDLMEAANLLEGEQVQVVNINNGARFETYTIAGERGSGIIGVNGAAARLAHQGDLVILIAYGILSEEEIAAQRPHVIFVDGQNRIVDSDLAPSMVPEGHGLLDGAMRFEEGPR